MKSNTNLTIALFFAFFVSLSIVLFIFVIFETKLFIDFSSEECERQMRWHLNTIRSVDSQFNAKLISITNTLNICDQNNRSDKTEKRNTTEKYNDVKDNAFEAFKECNERIEKSKAIHNIHKT